MKINSIIETQWDTSGSNNWARPASLNTYLNGTYYNELSNTAKIQIVAKDFSIGAVTYNDSNMANTINNENSKKWNGRIALATVSEYIRSNSNKNSCGTFKLNNENFSSCINTGWMDNNEIWWTLMPVYNNSAMVFTVSNGYVSSVFNVNNGGAGQTGVRPTLYLSPDIQITSGNGSQSNPYILG